jgi:hypothetical protein
MILVIVDGSGLFSIVVRKLLGGNQFFVHMFYGD